MNSPKLNYRYWKWVVDPNNDGDPDECWGVFREVIWEVTLQQAWLGGWRDAYHFQFRAWEDPEFVEIDETEANALIAVLLPKQQQRVAQEAITIDFYSSVSDDTSETAGAWVPEWKNDWIADLPNHPSLRKDS
jgi:hypothetical protein